MQFIIALSVLLTLAALTVPATAADGMTLTLADLRGMCAASDSEGQAACRFFILGAFQGLRLAGGVVPVSGRFNERKDGKAFCVPDNLPQNVMVQKVVSFADADVRVFPADANMPAISFVGAVIMQSYPCR
jgi:hypothetical protein